MNQILTVSLPTELYVRIKSRADRACRSVEQEAVALLEATIPVADAASDALPQALASLELLDNAAMEHAARSRLADELAAELETLHFKQQREGLTTPEDARRSELMAAYERSMLVRAHAAALLKKRGVDVSHLVAPA